MVLNTEPQTVELAYAGQNVSLAELEVTFLNERQRVQVSLSKSMARMRSSASARTTRFPQSASDYTQQPTSLRQTAALSRQTGS